MIAKSHYRFIPGYCWTNRIACDIWLLTINFCLAFNRLANGLCRAHYLFRFWLEPVKGWADETSCPQQVCDFILILYKSILWLTLTVLEMPCLPVTGTPSITLIFYLQSISLLSRGKPLCCYVKVKKSLLYYSVIPYWKGQREFDLWDTSTYSNYYPRFQSLMPCARQEGNM